MYCFRGIFYVGKDGKVPMPQAGERTLGGHAVCVISYNDKNKRVAFKNSWGTGWGNKGYGSVSYEYVRKYFVDMWVAKDIAVTADMLKGSVSLTS